MEVDSNLNTTVTMTTMKTLMYPLLQDPQARCKVHLLHVYVQVYSLVWACLCLNFHWMFYLQIKSTLVILWSIFIPLKINNAMNNIYQLVLITCAILSLSSWPLIPQFTIPKSEKFRFPKRVWSQGFRIRDCVPILPWCNVQKLISLTVSEKIHEFSPLNKMWTVSFNCPPSSYF
jgi:hypothetical protein